MKNVIAILILVIGIASCKKKDATPTPTSTTTTSTTTPTSTVTPCTSLIDTTLLLGVTWVARDTGFIGSYIFTNTSAINTPYASNLNPVTFQHGYYSPNHTHDRYYTWAIDATNCNLIHLSGSNNIDILIYELTATTIKANIGVLGIRYFDKQ